ncbi:MAG: type II toxin-antitoxin system HicA family toxin [Armatimonadetes bacterium]|nr:type II toxin-antitoxin system HicA family toxin [Armatimonadota bacterium]
MKAFTGKELVRLLREHGWQVVRIEGSQHILTKLGREETLSVPVHGSKSLKSGLVRGILKTAGILPY